MKNKVQKAYEEYLTYVNSEEYINKLCSQSKIDRMLATHTHKSYIRRVMYSAAGLTQNANPSLVDDIKRGRYDDWVNTPANICFVDSNWQIHPAGTLCHHCGKVHHREEISVPTVNTTFWSGNQEVTVATSNEGYTMTVKSRKPLQLPDFHSLCNKIESLTGKTPQLLVGEV